MLCSRSTDLVILVATWSSWVTVYVCEPEPGAVQVGDSDNNNVCQPRRTSPRGHLISVHYVHRTTNERLRTLSVSNPEQRMEDTEKSNLRVALGTTTLCSHASLLHLMHARNGVDSVSVKGGSLQGLTKEMLAGAVHIWTKEAVVEIPAGAESIEGEPSDD